MFFVYLGVYILFLLFIWGFFFVARIHAYKFSSFSKHIHKVTGGLFIFLVTLSILGFIFLTTFSTGTTKTQAGDDSSTSKEIYY